MAPAETRSFTWECATSRLIHGGRCLEPTRHNSAAPPSATTTSKMRDGIKIEAVLVHLIRPRTPARRGIVRAPPGSALTARGCPSTRTSRDGAITSLSRGSSKTTEVSVTSPLRYTREGYAIPGLRRLQDGLHGLLPAEIVKREVPAVMPAHARRRLGRPRRPLALARGMIPAQTLHGPSTPGAPQTKRARSSPSRDSSGALARIPWNEFW